MKITRLITVQRCGQTSACPAVLALDNGDYLIIGAVPTAPHLLDGLADHKVGVGDNEMAVVIPGDLFMAAVRALRAEDGDE